MRKTENKTQNVKNTSEKTSGAKSVKNCGGKGCGKGTKNCK